MSTDPRFFLYVTVNTHIFFLTLPYFFKNHMSQDHLVDLARLSIESEIARKINFDNVITCFALKIAMKAPLNAIVK